MISDLAETQSLYRNAWFSVQKPNPNASLRLFCFPYAGGSAAVFRNWPNFLDDSIELVCIQLPGRGARFREPLISSQGLLLEALIPEMLPYLDKPYAVFGHSMGAQMAFDLCRHLRSFNEPLPAHLMVSSRLAPQSIGRKTPIHDLPEEEFLLELKRLNGIPQEAAENPELMEIVSPVLRSDAKLAETWEYNEQMALPIAITAFGGSTDSGISESDMWEWELHTNKQFRSYQFPGDHFYLHQTPANLLKKIDRLLLPLAKGVQHYRYQNSRISMAM